MNKPNVFSLLSLLLLSAWVLSCAPNDKEATSSVDSSFQKEVRDAVTSEQWSEIFIKTYDSLKLNSTEVNKAAYWKTFSEILLRHKIPEEAEKGVLQTLRNESKLKGADSLIYILAENLNQYTDRKLIAKTYYKLLVDNYSNSVFLERASNNLPADMKPLRSQIQDAEEIIRERIEKDENLPTILIKDYVSLAQLHGIFNHTEQSAKYLYKAAALARGHGINQEAGILYDILIEDYSNLPESAKALFQKGFMLDQIDQNNEAAVHYKRFLETYPENELAPQVKVLLEEVNLTNEELLNRLNREDED